MRPLLEQVWRFGAVGLLATAVHVAVFFILVELVGVVATFATAIAWLMAFAVSFSINHTWTFAARSRKGVAAPRFGIVAVVGVLLNVAIMHVVTSVLSLSPRVGLGCVVVCVPPVTFLASRYWAFRPSAEP